VLRNRSSFWFAQFDSARTTPDALLEQAAGQPQPVREVVEGFLNGASAYDVLDRLQDVQEVDKLAWVLILASVVIRAKRENKDNEGLAIGILDEVEMEYVRRLDDPDAQCAFLGVPYLS